MKIYALFFRKQKYKKLNKLAANGEVIKLIGLLFYRSNYFIDENEARIMRESAATLLKNIPDLWSVDLFFKEIKKREIINDNVIWNAVQAILSTEDPKGRDILLAMLKGRMSSKAAIELGERYRDCSAIEELIQMLQYSGCDFKAEDVLKKIDPTRVIIALIDYVHGESYSRYIEMQRRNTDGGDGYRRIYNHIMNIFKNINAPGAIEPLLSAVDDPRIGECAIKALINIGIGNEMAVESLVKGLKDSSHAMRLGCVIALGKIKDKRAVEALIRTLEDEKDYYITTSNAIRLQCAGALAVIGDKRAVEPILKSFARYQFSYYIPSESNEADIAFKDAFKDLFGDYYHIIINCFCYSRGQEHFVQTTINDLSGHWTWIYDNRHCKEAVLELSKIQTPISNNILHIITESSDKEVEVGIDAYGDTYYGEILFEDIRNIAFKELQKRGTPPYDAFAFLETTAYRL